ncbi:MAG: acyltransferase family protein [Myxococcales bacterium]|nr:acyltransferase family protein [Myxococcales bacterium]
MPNAQVSAAGAGVPPPPLVEGPSERLAYLDALRVGAICGVVVIHVAARHVDVRAAPDPAWWTGNLWDAAVRWCVPLFVMLSGALLLNGPDLSPGRFYARRLPKIVIPLAFWSLAFYLFQRLGSRAPLGVGDFVGGLLGGSILNRYWFLYMILWLYLSAPFLKPVAARLEGPWLTAFVGLWIFAASLRPLLQVLFGISIAGGDSLFTEYLGFFLLGAALHRQQTPGWLSRGAPLLFVAGFLLTALGTGVLQQARGSFQDVFYRYGSPGVVAMAVGVFVFGKRRFGTRPAGATTVRLARLSFGIYLIHTFVQALLNQPRYGIELARALGSPIVDIPVQSILIWGASAVLALAIGRTPYLSRLVGL